MNKEAVFLINQCSSIFGLEFKLKFIDYDCLDWNKVLLLSTTHRIRPVLYKSLIDNDKDIPSDLIDKLHEHVVKLNFLALDKSKELCNLIESFRDIEVEIIPYKGIVLAESVYGELGSREFGDIDFLFDLQDFDRIESLLIQNGYKPEIILSKKLMPKFIEYNSEYNFEKYVDEKKRYHLEPHWYLGPTFLQTHITYFDLLSFCNKGEICGRTVTNILSPEGQFISAGIHHANSMCWSIKFIIDIVAIISKGKTDFDWNSVVDFGRKHKVLNLLLFNISMTDYFIKIEIPDFVRNLMNKRISQKLINKNVELIYNGRPSTFIWRFKIRFFQLCVREHISSKIKVVYNSIMYYLGYRIWNLHSHKSHND